jgi:hypothetical protein
VSIKPRINSPRQLADNVGSASGEFLRFDFYRTNTEIAGSRRIFAP